MVEAMSNPYVIHDGYNADALNGDEFNGAGTNWPTVPALLDSFEMLPPVVLTAAVLDGFNDCPDLVVACQSDTLTIRPQSDTVIVRKAA
jgi:hypothetical protein